MLATGVTAYRPTVITAAEEEMAGALASMAAAERAAREGGDAPEPLGAHLEGPFLHPDRLGAHPPEHRRDPDAALLERLLAAGPVAHVTLAPELPARRR